MLIPSIFALVSLTVARVVFPLPSNLEIGKKTATAKGFSRAYWLYMLAGACFAAGLTNFELISYHLSETTDVQGFWIPLFLGISTAIGVPIGLLLGRSFDRWGLRVVLIAVAISSLFSPLVFFGKFWGVLFGMVLWGVGYATQDMLLKAIIAGLLPENQRGLAFGLFYTGYGGGWLMGSVAAGVLYDRSLVAVVVLSMSAQILSLPLFIAAAKSDGEALRKRS